MTAAALATARGDPDRFARDLARRLRWWLLTIPVGIGLATLKSILKLWLGVSPERSGVQSAGNGPAMRAAIIGRVIPREQLATFVRASTRLTHRDEKAFVGAYAVALSSQLHADDAPHTFAQLTEALRSDLPASPEADELQRHLDHAAASVGAYESTPQFASAFCRKRGHVSGYIFETVPVALHAVYGNDTFEQAIIRAIECGGDTDSVASIVGGIRGTSVIEELDRLVEWPCNRDWLERLSTAAATAVAPPSFPFISRVARNVLMLVTVLAHVVRRTLPPYCSNDADRAFISRLGRIRKV